MSSPTFDFKQFTIHQDRCAMKVGTDGVLLGAWASGGSTILDIGAGTGLIALMMAQRFANAAITAVEIDTEAARQCHENFAASPWPDRLRILPHSLADAEPMLEGLTFDSIVSNPPFYNATLKPDDPGRAVARHKDALPIDQIAAFAQRHLAPQGTLSLIYPTAYDTEVMTACILHQLQPVRLCDVLTRQGKPSKRRMAAFALQPSAVSQLSNASLPSPASQPLVREQLSIRNSEGLYSPEYLHLVNDFYLTLKNA